MTTYTKIKWLISLFTIIKSIKIHRRYKFSLVRKDDRTVLYEWFESDKKKGQCSSLGPGKKTVSYDETALGTDKNDELALKSPTYLLMTQISLPSK